MTTLQKISSTGKSIYIITVSCPVCGYDDCKPLETALVDVEDGIPGAYDISRCGSCGLSFLSRRPDGASLPLCYRKDYHTRTGKKSLLMRLLFDIYHRLRFRDLNKSVFGDSLSVLEIGCGNGRFLTFLERHWDRATIFTGMDFEVDHSQTPATSKIKLVAGSVEHTNFSETFDVVIAHNVLEHLPEPVAALQRVGSFMKNDAVLSGQVPDWNSPWRRLFPRHWNGLHVPRHMIFFEEQTQIQTFERAGFVVERIQRVYDPGNLAVSICNYITDIFRLRTRPRQAWFYLPITLLGAPLGLLLKAFMGGRCALRFIARKRFNGIHAARLIERGDT